jgi:hypothetical protein
MAEGKRFFEMTGRPPIGKKAMSAAERQRRRRKKQAGEKSAAVKKALRGIAKQKTAARYIPMPPGITYWRYCEVRLADGTLKKVAAPETKPLAACDTDLDEDDILALIRRLGTMAKQRGLIDSARTALEQGGGTSGFLISV